MAAWRVFQRDSPGGQTLLVLVRPRGKDVDSEVKVSGGLDKRSPSVPDRGVNWSREQARECRQTFCTERRAAESGPAGCDLRRGSRFFAVCLRISKLVERGSLIPSAVRNQGRRERPVVAVPSPVAR